MQFSYASILSKLSKNSSSMVALLMLTVVACQAQTSSEENTAMPTSSKSAATELQRVSELKKIDTVVGEGREAEIGFNVIVHYTGWLYDVNAKDHKGEKFDSSLDKNSPFNFFLGGGQVIQGWDDGVQGMKVGGQRTLIIPAEMGYGARGAGGVIPPNADLLFEVELLSVK